MKPLGVLAAVLVGLVVAVPLLGFILRTFAMVTRLTTGVLTLGLLTAAVIFAVGLVRRLTRG